MNIGKNQNEYVVAGFPPIICADTDTLGHIIDQSGSNAPRSGFYIHDVS
jgi:hypothetical protein